MRRRLEEFEGLFKEEVYTKLHCPFCGRKKKVEKHMRRIGTGATPVPLYYMDCPLDGKLDIRRRRKKIVNRKEGEID